MWQVNILDRREQVNGLEKDNWNEKKKRKKDFIRRDKCTKIAHVSKKETLWINCIFVSCFLIPSLERHSEDPPKSKSL